MPLVPGPIEIEASQFIVVAVALCHVLSRLLSMHRQETKSTSIVLPILANYSDDDSVIIVNRRANHAPRRMNNVPTRLLGHDGELTAPSLWPYKRTDVPVGRCRG